MADETRGHGERESQRLWRLAAMGGTLATEIAAAAIIGYGLDYFLGTAPTLLIVLTCLGVVGSMAAFIRNAMRESRRAAGEAHRIAVEHRDTAGAPADAGEDDDATGSRR